MFYEFQVFCASWRVTRAETAIDGSCNFHRGLCSDPQGHDARYCDQLSSLLERHTALNIAARWRICRRFPIISWKSNPAVVLSARIDSEVQGVLFVVEGTATLSVKGQTTRLLRADMHIFPSGGWTLHNKNEEVLRFHWVKPMRPSKGSEA